MIIAVQSLRVKQIAVQAPPFSEIFKQVSLCPKRVIQSLQLADLDDLAQIVLVSMVLTLQVVMSLVRP